MDNYLKIVAGTLVSAILCLVLNKQGKEYIILISLAVCSMVFLAATVYIRPVFDFLMRLTQIGNISSDLIAILLKIMGIGLLSQIVALVCADAGNHSLVNVLHFVSIAVMLWIAIPLLDEMLSLMKTFLEAV